MTTRNVPMSREEILAGMGYMSRAQVCVLLGIGLKTLANRRDLPPRHKIGADSVYRTDEIRSWIARRVVKR
jgi:predicted DNA-binding transcriptional regulator AlpA